MTPLQRCKKGVASCILKCSWPHQSREWLKQQKVFRILQHWEGNITLFFWPLLIRMPNKILTSIQVKTRNWSHLPEPLGNWTGDRRGGWRRWNALVQPLRVTAVGPWTTPLNPKCSHEMATRRRKCRKPPSVYEDDNNINIFFNNKIFLILSCHHRIEEPLSSWKRCDYRKILYAELRRQPMLSVLRALS